MTVHPLRPIEVCPMCGLLVIAPDMSNALGGPTCNPVRSPGCWEVVGLSRNGGPLLLSIEGERA